MVRHKIIDMKFDWRYWILIAGAMVFATIASTCTLYLWSIRRFLETNTVAVAGFARFGMVPAMVLGILALPFVMVAIPYILGQNRKPGFISVLVLGCIVAYTLFDAVNDLSIIMGFHPGYAMTHEILFATNNFLGTIVGTGAFSG